jgi:hypothetical protein
LQIIEEQREWAILAREHPEVFAPESSQPNDIELGGPGPLRAGEPARRKPLGEWAVAGLAASGVSLCRAPATLDKAIEIKVSFYPAPSKDGLR